MALTTWQHTKKDYCRQLLSGGGGQVGASGPKRCFSVALKATHEASFRAPCHLKKPLKLSVSALKTLLGFETETRELMEGTEENSVSPMRGH